MLHHSRCWTRLRSKMDTWIDLPLGIIRVAVRLSQVTNVQLKGDRPQQPLKRGTCMIHATYMYPPCPLQHVRQHVGWSTSCLLQIDAALKPSCNLWTSDWDNKSVVWEQWERTMLCKGNDLLWQLGEGVHKGPCPHITYIHILDVPSCYSSHLAVLLLHHHSVRHQVSDSPTQLHSVTVFLPWYLLSLSLPCPFG